ncbi:MAG: PspA/IM30 family protein [Litoreibacter sp.]
MFKQLFTLARGRSEDAAQAVVDANALSILRQQLREAATGVEKSRKALAIVMAYADREKAILGKLETQVSDLETRALDALSQGQEDLAAEASVTIADLEAEVHASNKTIDTYSSQISRLRKTLQDSEAQLTELKRGQRLAEAHDKTQRLRGTMPSPISNDLVDATTTLKRLQERQEHAEATAAAMTELSTASSAASISDRLATAGCGAPKHSDAAAVLARLKKKT